MLEKLLKIDGVRLQIFKNIYSDICVCFENCYIKEDGFLIGSCGKGKTVEEAGVDYYNQIVGKKLVFYSGSKSSFEIIIL